MACGAGSARATEPAAMTRLPRLQLVEIEDLSWCPRTLRDLATDYLEFIEERLGMADVVAPVLRDAFRRSGARRIVDLCSGGGGPIAALHKALTADGRPLAVVLTDRYPNHAAFDRLARTHPGITFVGTPVDATAVPGDLDGFRTLFNAFHHFSPDAARGVLASAVEAGQPIAVFELSERSFRTLLALLLTPVAVWLGTPFMRPFRWHRLLWTYLVPIVPLLCLWDGVVSQWRAYTAEELRAMAEACGPGSHRWESGRLPHPSLPVNITFLLGEPQSSMARA